MHLHPCNAPQMHTVGAWLQEPQGNRGACSPANVQVTAAVLLQCEELLRVTDTI